MKKILLFVLLVLFGLQTSAQIFDIKSQYGTWAADHVKVKSDSTVFVAINSWMRKTDINGSNLWGKRILKEIECLHDDNRPRGVDTTPDGGSVGLYSIDESCIPYYSWVLKMDSTGNVDWLYEFAKGFYLTRGAVIFKDDFYHVYACHALSMNANLGSGVAYIKLDTNGVPVDSVKTIGREIFFYKELIDDSLLVVNYYYSPSNEPIQYCLEMWSMDLSVKRVIHCFDTMNPTHVYLQNDTFYMALNSSKSPRHVPGVAKVSRDGQGFAANVKHTSTSNIFSGIVVIDSMIVLVDNHRAHQPQDAVTYLRVYDKDLNYRTKELLPFYRYNYSNIMLFNIGDSLIHSYYGVNAFYRFDFSQVPPPVEDTIPTDTIPGDTIKISVPELNKQTQTNLFPNPTTTHFTLQSTQNIQNIQVFDLRGVLVLEQNVQSTEHQVQLSEAGTYIIHIHLQDGSTERQKVVKMKE